MEHQYFYALIMIFNNINLVIDIIKPIFLIFINFTPYKIYQIRNTDKISYFKNHVNNFVSTSRDDLNKPSGLILNMSFIAYIKENEFTQEIIIFTKEDTKNKLFNNVEIVLCDNDINNDIYIDEEKKLKKNQIEIVTRCGRFDYEEYSIRKINMKYYNFIFFQKCIFERIFSKFKQKNKLSVLISGHHGKGKTMLCKLIAKNLGASFTEDFDPSLPNTTLDCLYNSTKPHKNKPLVILLDEIDILINKIHKNKIIEHKLYIKTVTNKNTWNKFLDKIDTGFYPFVLLLMCTNKKKDYFDNLDKSYMRDGRIHDYIDVDIYDDIKID